MHGGGQINNVWGHFEYDEDCAVFITWARAFSEELETRQAVTRYQAYQKLLDLVRAQTFPQPSAGFLRCRH